MQRPPSTGRHVPVIMEADSLQSHKLAKATSLAVINRPRGIWPASSAQILGSSSSTNASRSGVRASAGQITFARIPNGAASRASALVKAITAPLLAE
jgi:hypothetical protein